MTKRSVHVETSPNASGHYSQGIVANGVVYLAGVGPYDPVTRAVVGETVGEQTAQVLRNIDAVLAGAGCRFADVVSCTAYLAELDRDWDAFDAAYGSAFEPPYPARTTVGAKLKGILVELSVVAVLGA